MKIDWQWPGAVVFTGVFLALSALVYANKIPHDALMALLAWLIPSPVQRVAKDGGS